MQHRSFDISPTLLKESSIDCGMMTHSYTILEAVVRKSLCCLPTHPSFLHHLDPLDCAGVDILEAQLSLLPGIHHYTPFVDLQTHTHNGNSMLSATITHVSS